MLPSVLLKAAVLTCAIWLAIFCCAYFLLPEKESAPIQIGYSAPDDQMTELAISFVENMDSVKSWCNLIEIEPEQGLHEVRQGNIAAFIVLPNQLVEGILNGNNQPAELYLSNRVVMGPFFGELVNAGIGLLQTAQAEIYATGKLISDFALDASVLEEMYSEIDKCNLRMALNREQYFHTKVLSATGNQSVVVYYMGAALAGYLMLLGVLWGRHLKRSISEVRICAQRLGVSIYRQILGRIGITWLMLFICLLPVMILLIIFSMSHIIRISYYEGMFLLIALSILVLAAGLQLVTIIAGKKQITWILTVTGILGGYVSGYFIPSSLLPDIVKKIAEYIPTTYSKQIFSGLLSGSFTDYPKALLILGIWSVLLSVLCMIFVGWDLNYQWQKRAAKRLLPVRRAGTIGILTKRLLSQKLFLGCLIITVVLSGMIMKMEEGSETTIYAGIYTENEDAEKLFQNQNRAVQFIFYQTEEELKRNIIKGKLECGYILQEGLQNEILNGEGYWSITEYQKADSTMSALVNEVLFERIFYGISTHWYEGFVANHENLKLIKNEIGEDELRNLARTALQEKLTDGSTFSVSTYFQQADSFAVKDVPTATYLLWVVMGLNLIFSSFMGIQLCLTDRRKGRFRHRHQTYMTCITILLPLCMAIMVNGVILLCFRLAGLN